MSEDDKWDSENFRADLNPKSGPIGLITNQWDGEDEEEEVKDSWDDPEDEELEEDKKETEDDESSLKAVQVKKTKKLLLKIEEKERKHQEELEAQMRLKKELMTPEELQAEKLRQQKLQEDADLEVAKDLIGDNSIYGDNSINFFDKIPVLEITDKLETVELRTTVLKTKEDFDNYKDEIIKQLSSVTKNQHFPGFVEQLIQALCAHLSANELKKLHTCVGNLQIEKNKVEQGTKSKKKGKGKAKLKLDDDTDIYSSYNEDLYEDFM